MKYILIALLFCTCGSSGEVEPTYFDSHFLGATYYPDKPDWQLSDGALDSGYHIERGLLYNFEVKDKLPIEIVDTVSFVYDAFNNSFIPITMTRLKDTIPKLKTKPLNIKMKPRWKDSVITFEGPLVTVIDDSNIIKEVEWVNNPNAQDTVRTIMLVGDTSSQNGYRTQRCYWMYGYQVCWGERLIEWGECEYLDENHKKLSKNLVVWMSKEIREH